MYQHAGAVVYRCAQSREVKQELSSIIDLQPSIQEGGGWWHV